MVTRGGLRTIYSHREEAPSPSSGNIVDWVPLYPTRKIMFGTKKEVQYLFLCKTPSFAYCENSWGSKFTQALRTYGSHDIYHQKTAHFWDYYYIAERWRLLHWATRFYLFLTTVFFIIKIVEDIRLMAFAKKTLPTTLVFVMRV